MGTLVTLLIKGVMGFGIKLLTTMASEKMIEWSFFKVAEGVANATATPHDDEWVQKIKDLYFEPQKSM